jgi:hypothetical protein
MAVTASVLTALLDLCALCSISACFASSTYLSLRSRQ